MSHVLDEVERQWLRDALELDASGLHTIDWEDSDREIHATLTDYAERSPEIRLVEDGDALPGIALPEGWQMGLASALSWLAEVHDVEAADHDEIERRYAFAERVEKARAVVVVLPLG